jgi:hypothetical protein
LPELGQVVDGQHRGILAQAEPADKWKLPAQPLSSAVLARAPC